MSRSIFIIRWACVPKRHNPQPMVSDHTLIDSRVKLFDQGHSEDLALLRDAEILRGVVEPNVVVRRAPFLQHHFLQLLVADTAAGVRIQGDAAHLQLVLVFPRCVVTQP